MCLTCAICLDRLCSNSGECTSVQCGHVFHRSCFQEIVIRSNGHIVRCPSCRVIASSFRVLFVDEEFCAGGDVSKKLTEQLTTKYNTEMTELKITYGRQITKLEKKSQAQNRKISQLEQENRELRQKFHFASMDGDGAQQKLLQICQVLETEPLRRNRKRTRQN